MPQSALRAVFALAVALCVVTLALGEPRATSEEPPARPADPPPKNLKVLPKEWTRRQVIEVMKGWTADLGVRCQHCHVGREGQPLAEWDFASDERPTKLRAREMVQMLAEVNRRLGEMPSLHAGSPAPRATCATCHRGIPRPRRIDEVFEETRAARGADAAIAEYRELRAQHSIGGSYDFSAKPLLRLARLRLGAQDAASAQKVMNLALELGWDSLLARMTMVDVALAQNDRLAAIGHLEHALTLAQSAEEKGWVQERLEGLRSQKPPR